MSKKIKVIVAVVVAVLVLTVGGAAIVMAQEEPAPTPQASGLLARVAEILDIHQETLVDAFKQARQEMRTYREETTVLRNLLGSIKSFQERKDDSFLSSYPPQDLVTYWTILRTRKSDVKEKRIREILKDLGLLEDHIITIRHVGYTDYELEPDESKRKNLLRQAETAEKERRLTFKVRKIVRKMQPNTRVHVRLQDEDKVAYCTIFSEIAEDDRINKRFVEEWGKKGFKTTQSKWTLSAVKTFSLTGREALSDIEQLLVKSLDQKPN